MFNPHHAIARFEIPDMPPGEYQIFHCNDPCTTTLGDIIGGWGLRVLSGSEGRPAGVIAEEVKASAATMQLLIPSHPVTTIPVIFRAEPAFHPGLESPTAFVAPSADEEVAVESGSTRTAAVGHLAVDDAIVTADAAAQPSPPVISNELPIGPVIGLTLVLAGIVSLWVWPRLELVRRWRRSREGDRAPTSPWRPDHRTTPDSLITRPGWERPRRNDDIVRRKTSADRPSRSPPGR